jgi:DNA-directed RNA polymerase subunit RPC12/RpoP
MTAPKTEFQCPSCSETFNSASTAESVECPACSTHIRRERALWERARHDPHLRPLTAGPQTDIHRWDFSGAELVDVLRPVGPPNQRGKSVYYLMGDDREAVREFIRQNTAQVAECLSTGGNNRLAHHWDEYHYTLLKQQWYARDSWLDPEELTDTPATMPAD